MSREHITPTITQEEAVTIPDKCLVTGANAFVYTNAVVDGERYLSGRAYCKRAPQLEYQKKFEVCPAVETCILHKFESRVEVSIESDSDKDEKLKELEKEINRAKASASAYVM